MQNNHTRDLELNSDWHQLQCHWYVSWHGLLLQSIGSNIQSRKTTVHWFVLIHFQIVFLQPPMDLQLFNYSLIA